MIRALVSITLSLVMQLSLSLQDDLPSSLSSSEAEETQPSNRRKRKQKKEKIVLVPFQKVKPLSIELSNRASKEENKVKKVDFPRRRGSSNGAKELCTSRHRCTVVGDKLTLILQRFW